MCVYTGVQAPAFARCVCMCVVDINILIETCTEVSTNIYMHVFVSSAGKNVCMCAYIHPYM